MKKIRVKTVIYDRTTCEYIQKWITHTISDELADMIRKEFHKSDGSAFEVHGFGSGEDGYGKIPGLRTPLCSQKRFVMDTQFHVIDEDGKIMAGWMGI